MPFLPRTCWVSPVCSKLLEERASSSGLFTQPVAFLLAGRCVGYFRAHAPRGFWPITNGGELAVIYSFYFLWLSSSGAGPWSLDRLLKRKT